jgi:hypothetical protein
MISSTFVVDCASATAAQPTIAIKRMSPDGR